MNAPAFPYKVFPAGDAAIAIEFGNCINEDINKEVIARYHQLQQQPLYGMIEAVPAYSSLTIYYDIMAVQKIIPKGHTVYDVIKRQVEEMLQQTVKQVLTDNRLLKIPVCYENEFAPDLLKIATEKNSTIEEIIQLHTAKNYKVYMLGFLPGFAYMGTVDERIAFARKPNPVTVAAGSVGIAGVQTGIYPLTSPGGWQIIGRTPLQLFNRDKEVPTLLKAGDNVQFYAINKNEFDQIKQAAKK